MEKLGGQSGRVTQIGGGTTSAEGARKHLRYAKIQERQRGGLMVRCATGWQCRVLRAGLRLGQRSTDSRGLKFDMSSGRVGFAAGPGGRNCVT